MILKKHTDKEVYCIRKGSRIAKINGRRFFDDLNDIKIFLSHFPIKLEEYSGFKKNEYKFFGEFDSVKDLTEKFAEYLI